MTPRQPIGWATPHLETDALRAEARLEGGAATLDHVIELVKAGLMSAMSIGFTVGADDQWSRGPTPDAPPRVLRRGAKLRDVSWWFDPPTTQPRSNRSAIEPRSKPVRRK